MNAMVQELVSFIRSYVVPEGFPHSVAPSYVPYMTWRALKVVMRIYIHTYIHICIFLEYFGVIEPWSFLIC